MRPHGRCNLLGSFVYGILQAGILEWVATSQISYDYTVEVMNRFKGLGLVDRAPEELWTEVQNIVQEAVTKTIPKKSKCKKAKR